MLAVRAVGLFVAVSTLMGLLACANDRRPAVANLVEDEQPAQRKADKEDTGLADLGDLNAEVNALQILIALDVTDAQLATLARLAAKTMEKPPPRKLVKASEKFRKTLRALRDALVRRDEDKIDAALATLDELSKKEMPDLDDVEITDNARKNAPALLRQLSARQVAGYLGSLPEVPDPVERLEAALKRSRELRGRAWQEERDVAAAQVGWLIGGVDTEAEKKARERAEALLNRAHKLEDKEFQGQRDALLKEARDLRAALGPTDILRHFMERVLAETLSNHRLAAAVAALRKKK